MHFFIPIYPAVQYTVLILGLIGLVMCRSDLGGLPALGYAILAFASVFFHPAAVPYYDNGLYHVPTLLWNTQTALTPGLANLHDRFGFNSLLFLISPIVATPAAGWRANSMVASFTLLACLGRLRDHANREVSAVGFWFLVIVLGGVTLNDGQLTGWLSVLNADSFVATLIVYWTFLLFEYEQGMRPDTAPSLMLLLAAFAVMTKLGAVPALVVTIILIGSSGVPETDPQCEALARPQRRRPCHRAMIAAATFLTIWAARGFLLSGCGAYPIPQTCVNSLPWSVGAEQAQWESDGIRSYARNPGPADYKSELSEWRWFGPWLDDQWNREPFPALRWALLLGVGAIIYCFLARKKIDRASPRIAAILAVGIAFWFWAAPDPRFGIGYLAAMGILSAAVAAGSLVARQRARSTVVAVLLAGMAAWTAHAAASGAWGNLPAIPPVTPKRAIITINGAWGVPIRVPEGKDDRCWDTPLPCIPWYSFAPSDFQKVYWRTLKVRDPSVRAGRVATHLHLPLRINAGGAAYPDSQGQSWLPDVGAAQGWPISTTSPISGTSDPALYRTARYSESGRLDYQCHVPDGKYTVNLKFAEILHFAAGRRVFDITLNGTRTSSRFDIFAAAGGANKAFDLRYPVTVTDGQIAIALTALIDRPMINALEILSDGPDTSETWASAGAAPAPKVHTSSPPRDTVRLVAELLNYDLEGLLTHTDHMAYGKAPAKPLALPRGVFKVTDSKDHFATKFQPIGVAGSPPVTAVEVSVVDQLSDDPFASVNIVFQDQNYNVLYSTGTPGSGEDHTLVALPASARSVRVAFLANEEGFIRFPKAVRLRAFTNK